MHFIGLRCVVTWILDILTNYYPLVPNTSMWHELFSARSMSVKRCWYTQTDARQYQLQHESMSLGTTSGNFEQTESVWNLDSMVLKCCIYSSSLVIDANTGRIYRTRENLIIFNYSSKTRKWKLTRKRLLIGHLIQLKHSNSWDVHVHVLQPTPITPWIAAVLTLVSFQCRW